ncbi:MAG: hypothetical protein OXT07_01475 [bacterium]|nr:hypothetical protein [bacterium]
MVDTTDAAPSIRPERGDPRLSPESRAKLHALTEGEELQKVLDEVGKRHPDLSTD